MAESDTIGGVDSGEVLDRILELQREIRRRVISARGAGDAAGVARSAASDTIYTIDVAAEDVLDEFCRDWGKSTPLVLIAEGIEDSGLGEGVRVYPEGSRESDARLRLIVDPIDGTRGLMYDKRPAWSLAGVAPNGPGARLRDIQIAAMTELPTSKMGWADVLWAIRGGGAEGAREDLSTGRARPLALNPSRATSIDHGFATVSNFFPGTKVLASTLMERIALTLVGPADVTRATVFDDQYICTGGQFYELIVGHDRFNADLRPEFYRLQGLAEGMCCHPYDCAAALIAVEAGVILTGPAGEKLDCPLDVTTGVSWLGYANAHLQGNIQPIVREFLREPGTARSQEQP